MKQRAVNRNQNQGSTSSPMSIAMQQLALPMMVATEAIKKGLLSFVQQMGMLALSEMLSAEAEAIAGPKGKHDSERDYHHWGTTRTSLAFGGRKVIVERPRVRGKGRGGQEVDLPSLERLREEDPMPHRVAEQIVAGVSTRGYERSLEPVDDELEARGTSKSHVSRALVERTTKTVTEFLERRLDALDIVGVFIDGIEIGKHAVVIALGITADGIKVPLGLWAGSTENAVVATSLVQNLIERGLKIEAPTLFVIDGGKGIHKALRDVFGDRAVIQRCQVHKLRNVRDHLPKERHAYVARQMRDAYRSRGAKTAKKKLQQLVSWLEANGEDAAAASLREGLDESLTVLRLGLPDLLARSLGTTNAIENMNSTLRRVLRNVKRWRDETMIKRWVALGIVEAQRGFRRIKGYQKLHELVAALRPNLVAGVDDTRKAA